MKTYAIFDDSFFRVRPFWIPEKLYRVVCQRANPRSKEYMLSLLREKFPKAEMIELYQEGATGRIILLYPDSIGLGWKKIEKKLAYHPQIITVLNGRRRGFELTSSVYKQLLFRRFLEITFLPEIVFTPFILLYGAFITIKDKISSCRS